jgi:hypothetical protein
MITEALCMAYHWLVMAVNVWAILFCSNITVLMIVFTHAALLISLADWFDGCIVSRCEGEPTSTDLGMAFAGVRNIAPVDFEKVVIVLTVIMLAAKIGAVVAAKSPALRKALHF